ncbi:hypothetical protein H4217_000322 [Coemansia sp. RSA 1939]|nr:hypothetical protein H4217_000322 [Coemansia sp. RSA 1939]KAJ2617650.1 hypothetical protein EV177_000475 [Coemansia sp. RSA 1804]KAJ2695452.1 hypothetical protein GGH99_000098 [Coemansia sp. RSA 1285]
MCYRRLLSTYNVHTRAQSASHTLQQTATTAVSVAPPAGNYTIPSIISNLFDIIEHTFTQWLHISNPFTYAAPYIVSAVQGVAFDINLFNQQAAQQWQSFATIVQADISSLTRALQTNPVFGAIALPVTNLSQFILNAENAASSLESQINSEISYINGEINNIVSVAAVDVNAALTDVSVLLESIYSFMQNGIEIMLGSPLLTSLTLLDPVFALVTAAIAIDPVNMATNNAAWQSEFSSRQSVIVSNFNQVYTLFSSGLPQAESVLLGILSQIADLTNMLTSNGRAKGPISKSLLQSNQLGSRIKAALAGASGMSMLPGLDAESNEMHAALQSAAYYHLQTASVTAQHGLTDNDALSIPTPTEASSIETL